MANKIDTLKAEIAEMEEVANDPSTPEDVKKALAPAIKNAKAQLSTLTPSSSAPSAKPSSKAPAAPKPAAAPKPEVKKSDSGSKPSSLKDCQDLLEKYKDKKKSDKDRVQKRADQGKPPVLTPSEVVKKTATSVKAKVIEIKKADKKLPASEITKITNGIISTIKGTLSGMTSAVTKKAFLSDIINELRKLERNLPIAAMHGAILAAGGRTTSAINRDRMFQSQEEWEKNYNRKGEPGRRYMEAGGETKKLAEIKDLSITKTGYGHWLIKLKVDNPALLLSDDDYYWKTADREDESEVITLKTTTTNSRAIDGHDGYEVALASECITANDWDTSLFNLSSLKSSENEEGDYMASGGETMSEENADLLQSQIKSIKHHSDELSSIVGDTPIEPWVLARATRAASDLSDITHYLDGVVKKKYKRGGVTSSQANLFESGGNNQEYFSADEVKNHLEQDGYNIHNDTQLRAIASIEGYKFDQANNRWYYSQKQHTVHEYAQGGEVAEIVTFDSMYDGEVQAYESTSQKGLFYYVNNQGNNFIVMAEAEGYPASEAVDDWFTSNEAAMQMAKDLAEGKANDFFAKGGVNKTNYFLNTKVDWDILDVGKKAFEKFNELKQIPNVIFKESPNDFGLHSQYIIDVEHEKIYRISDHWGNVASCSWGLKNNKIPDWLWRTKPYILASANFNEFKRKEESPDDFDKYQYQLELESRVNPDFSSSESGNVVIKPKKYWVKNMDHAKKMALDFIKDNSLGGGNYVPANIYKNGKKIATVSYNGKVWDEETGNEHNELVEKSSESERIAKMVKGWNEEGRAFSYLSKMDQDDEFFEKIGVSPDKMGITSQTGNDIVYYDTSRYESDNNALRKIKKLAIGGIIEHGINKGDLIVDVYKDYGIIAEGGDKNVIVAWDPNVGTRYYAGIDETKPVGSRDMGLTYEEKIKDAKKYIDFLDNEIKVKAGLRRAEKGMQLSSGHNYPKVQLKGYDNSVHDAFWYVVEENDTHYKLVFEEKIDHYEETKGTPDEMFYTEWEPKSEYEPYNKLADGGINKTGDKRHLPVQSDFTVEGLPGQYRGYTFGDYWNGWEVPYFKIDVANKIAKDSFQGDDESHFVYDANKNVFIHHDKEWNGEWSIDEVKPFKVGNVELFPIGSYNWAWEKKAKSEPVKSVNKPLETITYKGEEITHSEHMPEFWFVGDEEFKSLAAAKKHIDGGSKPSARTVNAYRHGAMKKGGEVSAEKRITKAKFDKIYPESKFDIQIKRFFVKAEGYEVPTHDLVKYYIVAEKGNNSKPIIYKQVSDKKVELVDKLPEPSKK